MTSRTPRWWRTAIAAVAALTSPADIQATDDEVRRVASDSAIWRACDGALVVLGRAWTVSRWRGFFEQPRRDFAAIAPVERVRLGGLTVAIAAAAAAAFVVAGSRSRAALIVPALACTAGVIASAAAEPLRRAIENRSK
jgi:hypothetical protein